MIEFIGEQYEDMERLREQSVVHADQMLEEDNEILEYQAEYHRELAQEKEQTAVKLLRRLHDYEARLELVLQDIRALKLGKPTAEMVRKEASKQMAFLDQVKRSVFDSDETLLDWKDKSDVYKKWAEEETHLKGMVHAIDTDPDLSNVVKHKEAAENKVYMEKESHKHDSLLDEIEHSIATDPDLANISSNEGVKTTSNYHMAHEAHVHDSLLNEVEHSIDNDAYLA